jgi:hypothetical protein
MNSFAGDYFMIGGSPVPPNCPMRRFESCSNGCSVCEPMFRCLLRLEVFFGPACLPLFFALVIRSLPFCLLTGSSRMPATSTGLIDNPYRTGLRAIVALFLVPLHARADV